MQFIVFMAADDPIREVHSNRIDTSTLYLLTFTYLQTAKYRETMIQVCNDQLMNCTQDILQVSH